MFMYRKNKVWQKFLRGSEGDHPPRRGLGQHPKILILNLNKKFHAYGGLGAQPPRFWFFPEGMMSSRWIPRCINDQKHWRQSCSFWDDVFSINS
ncbi:MAG: hypothetical protein HW380_1521 [Magnetococcales bacterium]|nr:hypothetical protein [Magnetococcales bacterium]